MGIPILQYTYILVVDTVTIEGAVIIKSTPEVTFNPFVPRI